MIVDTKYDKNKNLVAISLVNELLLRKEKPVFLCVGTEKVISDSVGAMVGEILKKKYKINGYVYGDFDQNVTAKNLTEIISEIKLQHPYSPIVLIDGILGESYELGQVKFYPHGAIPGGGFNEGVLVGDYSILAVVDTKGICGLNLLNSVRLGTIVKIAEFIADSISRAFKFSQNLILN